MSNLIKPFDQDPAHSKTLNLIGKNGHEESKQRVANV